MIGCADLAAEAYEDDPMPYQQELIAREQLLGPDHPDVRTQKAHLVAGDCGGARVARELRVES